jgi:hypothetical protein
MWPVCIIIILMMAAIICNEMGIIGILIAPIAFGMFIFGFFIFFIIGDVLGVKS